MDRLSAKRYCNRWSKLIYTFSKRAEVPWMEGGRYGVLRGRLMEFFTSLKSRGIELLVVLEGLDHNRTEKECIRIERRKKRNQGIARSFLENKGTNSLSPLPVLSFKVILMIMEELGIPVIYTDGEADRNTVAIANYYNYPVLANDSDYYMYDIKAGYIPLTRLNLHARPLKLEVYKLCDFNSQFGLSDPQLSRVIPAVLGSNDFIETDLLVRLTEGGVISKDKILIVRLTVWFDLFPKSAMFSSSYRTSESIWIRERKFLRP